jgi:hypothetical protein
MRAGKIAPLWLGLVTAATLAVAGGDSMPQVLYTSQPEFEHPIWVAAEAALAPDGTVNEELFGQSASTLESHLAMEPTDGCIRLTEFYSQPGIGPPSRESVELAARNVAFALHGRITGKAYGFYYSTPGQLLRLEPIELLKGGPESHAVYYVFFPVGTFSVGDYDICKTDDRYPEPPEIGDELLVTDPWRTRKDDSFVNTWGPKGVIAIESDGTVHLPKWVKLLGDEETVLESAEPDKVGSEAAQKLTRERLIEVFKKAAGEAK